MKNLIFAVLLLASFSAHSASTLVQNLNGSFYSNLFYDMQSSGYIDPRLTQFTYLYTSSFGCDESGCYASRKVNTPYSYLDYDIIHLDISGTSKVDGTFIASGYGYNGFDEPKSYWKEFTLTVGQSFSEYFSIRVPAFNGDWDNYFYPYINLSIIKTPLPPSAFLFIPALAVFLAYRHRNRSDI